METGVIPGVVVWKLDTCGFPIIGLMAMQRWEDVDFMNKGGGIMDDGISLVLHAMAGLIQ